MSWALGLASWRRHVQPVASTESVKPGACSLATGRRSPMLMASGLACTSASFCIGVLWCRGGAYGLVHGVKG